MDEQLTPQQALSQAVNRIGGQSAMGRLLDISQAAVWKWLDEGMVLPAEHVLKVEAATRVSRNDLRPDLYPRGLQDGIPFQSDPEGIAAIGDLAAGASPEWPLPPGEDDSAENGTDRISERPAA